MPRRDARRYHHYHIMPKKNPAQHQMVVSSSHSSSPSSSLRHLDTVRDLLRVSSLAPSTVSAYSAAVRHFLHFCHSSPAHAHHHLPHPSAALELDCCMEEFISFWYRKHSGRNKQGALNAIYGVYFLWPEYRHSLRRSEQLLRGWNRLAPPVSHPPLTWPLTVLIAITLAKNGQVDAAIATLVAFDALLRCSELVGLLVTDVSLPGDLRRGTAATSSRAFGQSAAPSLSRVCLRLSQTKTGKNQWTELYTERVGQLLALHLQHRSSSDWVFNFPSNYRASYYRHLFRVACTGLDLDSCCFTPHSLRHGGATHAHIHLHQSIEHIMHRGRWLSNDTCRIYIQSGNSALLAQRLPFQLLSTAEHLAGDWFTILLSLCFPDSL